VNTFHVVSECKTAVYFSQCLIQALAQQIHTAVLTIGINIASPVTTADRLRLTTIDIDRTRP